MYVTTATVTHIILLCNIAQQIQQIVVVVGGDAENSAAISVFVWQVPFMGTRNSIENPFPSRRHSDWILKYIHPHMHIKSFCKSVFIRPLLMTVDFWILSLNAAPDAAVQWLKYTQQKNRTS